MLVLSGIVDVSVMSVYNIVKRYDSCCVRSMKFLPDSLSPHKDVIKQRCKRNGSKFRYMQKLGYNCK